MIEDPTENMFVCLTCGQFQYPLVNTYSDEEKVYEHYNPHSIYIRLNHFKEILNQLQGKETRKLSNEKFCLIKQQFEPKESVQENIIEMKKLLRKLKLNKFIKITINILTNLKILNPPVINEHLQETLYLKFCNIENNFSKIQNEDRKNMIPVHYLLFKFFKELNLTKHIPFLSFTKNKKLLERYDNLKIDMNFMCY